MNLGAISSLAYGILVMTGGIIGYFQAGSKVSLISGTGFGLSLLLSAFLQFQGQAWGLILAVVVTSVLVVFFAFRLAKTRKFMPAGLMIVVGVAALAMMMNQILGA
jgi:uncharacterized membrane protein (UPF0136 family)